MSYMARWWWYHSQGLGNYERNTRSSSSCNGTLRRRRRVEGEGEGGCLQGHMLICGVAFLEGREKGGWGMGRGGGNYQHDLKWHCSTRQVSNLIGWHLAPHHLSLKEAGRKALEVTPPLTPPPSDWDHFLLKLNGFLDGDKQRVKTDSHFHFISSLFWGDWKWIINDQVWFAGLFVCLYWSSC